MEDELLEQTSLSLDPSFPLEPPIPDRSPFRYEDECKVLEFPVRNFWKIAKTQNDIESLTEGHCNGFYYRLLLHPRGTAGTDSESNHLSVFLEAVVQDWYPEYWVFPNVRFELTVVNFKDPKQSVTSWAHWSFSSDATSRGWQKMISHSKLTKAAGFMDEEGTILVRGKAEPPYPRLWSRSPPYRPTKLWASIRIPPYEMPDKLDSIMSDTSEQSQLDSSQSSVRDLSEDLSTSFSEGSCVNPWHKHEEDNVVIERILSTVDPLVPSIQPTLDSDVLALFICILYNLKEFRKRILSFPYEDIFTSTQGEKNYSEASNNTQNSGSANIISALQDTFAYMYLYPIAATCKSRKASRPLGLSTEDFYMNEILHDMGFDRFEASLSSPFHFEPTLHVNCSALDCEQCNHKNTLYTQEGDRIDPQLPNIKRLLLTLHMNDLQFLENSDPFTKIHTYIFTILLKDMANVRKILKQRRLSSLINMSKSESDKNLYNSDASQSESADSQNLDEKSNLTHENTLDLSEDGQPIYLHDQTDLEATCKSLFSGSPDSDCLFRSSCDISSVYIRCKHINSLQKALETSGHAFLKYPGVLFFYLQPNKNTKKGELFDVPLRLDATCLVPNGPDKEGSEVNPQDSSHEDESIKSYTTSNTSTDIEKDLNQSLNYVSDRQRGPNRDDLMANPALQYQEGEKWYSLYALVIKEGDRGGVSSYSLLLRPDEDGPWYRLSEGRVERLETKMEFTEWKCHREFFCASAVYIAEDYIDLIQARDVDLSGDLKQWNPKLYYKTMERLGVTEEQILSEKPVFDPKKCYSGPDSDLIDYCHPRSRNVLIRRTAIGIATPSPCKIHGYTRQSLVAQHYNKLIKSCVRLDLPQLVTRRLRRLALLQPLLVITLKKSNTHAISPAEANLLDKCLELEFITTLGEIIFSERANQLLFNGRSKCPHLDSGQYHLTPQGRLYGFHVTMLLIQPLRDLFAKMLEFAAAMYDETENNGQAKIIALEKFCNDVQQCYSDCLDLLKESGNKIKNTHYMIIDELRGNSGSDFISKHLGLSCDFLNPRYDLPVHKTNEVMATLTSCYGLPSLFEMQCYLRHRGIYLHGLIRPHEIARMYIHFRPLLKGHVQNPPGHGQLNSSADSAQPGPAAPAAGQPGSQSENLNSTLATPGAPGSALGKTLNPFKFSSLQYPALQIVWNEELFTGRPPDRSEKIESRSECRARYDRAITNTVTKVLVHLLPHPTLESLPVDADDALLLITELDLAEILPEFDEEETKVKEVKEVKEVDKVTEEKELKEVDKVKEVTEEKDINESIEEKESGHLDLDSDSCTCSSIPFEMILKEEPVPPKKNPFSSLYFDQKTANTTYSTLFPPPLLNIDRDEANAKNLSLSHFPFSLSQSLSDGLDPEFRRLLGERIISSPLFNDLLSIPEMQCGDLLSQVVSDVCAVQIGLLFPSDLFGCEGFYIEDKLFPSRRLTLNIELPGDRFEEPKSSFSDPFQRGYSMLARTEHLYWGVRKLLRLYLDEDVDCGGGDLNQAKKAKGKSSSTLICPCGNNCFSHSDECQKLLKWRPTCGRDAFMLYALRCDIDLTRQGKRRFVYMHPEIEIASYIDPRKGKKMPGLVVLVAFAPQCLVQTPTIFPLTDDSDYPLLLFKWMCTKSVDLLTVGAIVCDSKCHLQHYITEWLLPIVKKLGYLEGEQLGGAEKDITRYMVLEECGVRTLQNVRRCSCAIKKINKRTGDVIIIQLKRQTDSPSSLKFKDKVSLMNSIRQLEELESLELLPQSVALKKLELDPAQYFTLDQVSVGSYAQIESKIIKQAKKRDKAETSSEREQFESTGSNLVSREGRMIEFQTLPTTSEANLTADGISVEDDQFMEDENKRLPGGRKKGKGRRKVVIPCNKKSTFNRQVVEGGDVLEENAESDLDIPEPLINKHIEELKQILAQPTPEITDYREKAEQINMFRKFVEIEYKDELDAEITRFFKTQADLSSDEFEYAFVFAWIDLQEFDKFPNNANTICFFLRAIEHLIDYISKPKFEEGLDDLDDFATQIGLDNILPSSIRRLFDQIMRIAGELSGKAASILPRLLPITRLTQIEATIKAEFRILARKLRIPIASIDASKLIYSCLDFIAIIGKVDGWCIDYCYTFIHDFNPEITILSNQPIKIGLIESNCIEIMISNGIYRLYAPINTTSETQPEFESDFIPHSDRVTFDYNFLHASLLYNRWHIKEIRNRKTLHYRLLRNISSLLTIMQRKIMPALPTRWSKIIFSHSGELAGVSLPSGVTVGPGRECTVKRQLLEHGSTIAGSRGWKFLLILACNEFGEDFNAEIKFRDLIIHISSKFIDSTVIRDCHVASPHIIMDECRGIIESLERKFCLVNNYSHHLPNLPASPAQDLPEFATLLLSRVSAQIKAPQKAFLPLVPPSAGIPAVVGL